jgi:ribosome recycling factor
MSHPVLRDAKEKMDKSLVALQRELGGIRTSRANPALLDIVDVEAYGTHMKINQLGVVSVPDPTLLTIDLWDKSLIPVVEKAILASPLGLTPSNDGKVIRIPMPKLTEERRKDLIKVAHKHAEEARVAVRNVRRHALEEIRRLQKEGELPEDDAHRLMEEIQKITDKHIETIDELVKKKEVDIMEV